MLADLDRGGHQSLEHTCEQCVFEIIEHSELGWTWIENGERTSLLELIDLLPPALIGWAVATTYRVIERLVGSDAPVVDDLDRLRAASSGLVSSMSRAATRSRVAQEDR